MRTIAAATFLGEHQVAPLFCVLKAARLDLSPSDAEPKACAIQPGLSYKVIPASGCAQFLLQHIHDIKRDSHASGAPGFTFNRIDNKQVLANGDGIGNEFKFLAVDAHLLVLGVAHSFQSLA